MKKITSFVLSFLFALTTCNVTAQSKLWGAATGSTNVDVLSQIYSMVPGATSITDNVNLQGYSSGSPFYGQPVLATNGKIYGASYGGAIFEYDPINNIIVTKVTIPGGSISRLVEIGSGNIYFTSINTIYRYAYLTNTLTALYVLSNSNGQGCNSLTLANNGLLYGTCSYGGANNHGTIFSYNITTNAFSKIFDFDNTSGIVGGSSLSAFSSAPNGMLYSCTRWGGVNNMGTIFELNPITNTVTKKIDLSPTTGAFFYSSLMLSSAGTIYGLTSNGGYNGGYVVEYDYLNNLLTVRATFTQATGTSPAGWLVEDSSGNLYGTSYSGGIYAHTGGTLFKFNPATNLLSQLHSFSIDFVDINDGKFPYNSPILLGNKLVGFTFYGGVVGNGVGYEYDLSTSTYTKKFAFGTSLSGNNLNTSMTLAANGKLYGATQFGGVNEIGVIYEFDPSTLVYTKKIDLSTSTGYNCTPTMALASNGKLYGIMATGGINNLGLLFEYDPVSNTLTNKFNFSQSSGYLSNNVQSSLVLANNGKLYGICNVFGSSGAATCGGTLYSFDPSSGVFTVHYNFSCPSTSNPSNPTGGLCLAASGKLYGFTSQGGATGYGNAFEFDVTTNILTHKASRSQAQSGVFTWSPTEGANGRIYAVVGGFLEYNPFTNVMAIKTPFMGSLLATPTGSLLQASNGKMYGTTYNGGSNDYGFVYEYTPGAATITKLLDFTGANGTKPRNGKLVEIFTSCVNPTVPIINPTAATTVCAGTPVTLTLTNALLNSATQWRWYTGSCGGTLVGTGTTITVTPTVTTRYYVRAEGGCVTPGSCANKLITVNPSVTPTISVSATASTICTGTSVTFTAAITNGGTTPVYQWKKNGNNVGTNQSTFSDNALANNDVISCTLTSNAPCATSTTANSNNVTMTVYVPSLAATSASSSAAANTICSGTNVTLTVNGGSLGGNASWKWYDAGCGTGNLAGTGSSIIVSPATTTTYHVRAEGFCNTTTCVNITITVNTSPPSSISAGGPTTLCGAITSVQLNETSATPGVTYQWQINGTDISGETTASYVATAGGSYTCNVSNATCTTTSNAIVVVSNSAPSQPDPIIGITQSCNPQNNVTFSIPAVAGATSYNWYSTNPAVTINPPNGGTTISVNLGATTSSTWSLRVEPINACGTGAFRGTSIRRIISAVTTVTGTNVICSATNGVAYTCNVVGGADNYLWTVPSGATISSGQGTTSVIVDFDNSFNGGSICVASQLSCGFSATPKCFAIAKGNAAPVPGNVSGNSTVCAGASGNFSIVAITGVTYNWAVPPGASITSGGGTNAITVLFPPTFSSGNVCVNVTNACGITSTTKCRSVVNSAPSRPSGISGVVNGVCNSIQSYTSASSSGATSYLWSVTSGTIQSGQGTQTVSVLWNSSGTTGTLNVNGVNSCGNGLVRSVSVNLKPSSTASITGNTAACANTAEVYNFTSLYGVSNYLWAVNTASGAAVTAGQGTTLATIQWVTNGGTVYCTPSNACGSSSTKTLAVSITCRQATQGVVDENNLFNVSAIPNPFNNELNIQSSVYGNGVTLNISDMLGRIISTQPINSENTLLQTSQLKNGIYFVEVINGTEKKTIKVVKTQ